MRHLKACCKLPGAKAAAIAYALFYVAWHMWTLPYAPLPWFDEVVFASISRHWIESASLVPGVTSAALHGLPFKIYGFVSFTIHGISMQLLPLPLGYRLPTFLFGCLLLLLCRHLFGLPWWMLLVFSLDPFLQLSMHEGRMDLEAVFWSLSAWYFLGRTGESRHSSWMAGVMALLAILTTPRSFVLLLPPAFIALRRGEWRFFLPLCGGYALWVLWAFGSPRAWLNHYLYDFALLKNYVGNSGYVPRHEYLLIGSVCLSAVLYFAGRRRLPKEPLFVASVSSILTFYLVVFDYGPYSVFILPLYYYLLFFFLQAANKRLRSLVLGCLLLFNLGYTFAKQVQVFMSLPMRDYRSFHAFVCRHIPPGSKVVSEPMPYYALLEAGADLQLMDYYNTTEERERIHREEYRAEYMIVTDHLAWRKAGIVALYRAKANWQPIARYERRASAWLAEWERFFRLSSTERTGYNCTIYRRRF
ncbi:MAG: hypothetical protein KatS3mg033_0901 [Thermonema sp.]|uniref:hypothetical protein n=1 Tax=Thermonema sp. TaxID=2231181 RepID=UPI0021DCFB10|nr:hypothetical protein [Thermonema sp.]GIV39101.1 MAG: hypothetical protein KatS3mg033_0901 [Thermonema sp.]